MLIAYEDQGFKIRYIPPDGAKIPLYPIDSFAKAEQIQAWAKKERPDVRWALKKYCLLNLSHGCGSGLAIAGIDI